VLPGLAVPPAEDEEEAAQGGGQAYAELVWPAGAGPAEGWLGGVVPGPQSGSVGYEHGVGQAITARSGGGPEPAEGVIG
jgi:hypothetical protein